MSFALLSALYWVHILSTVAWLGSQAALLLWVLPLGTRYLPEQERIPYLARTLRQALPWQWFSALLLLATGMFQMSANPYYEGLLAVTNRWAVSILLKHFAYGGMLAVNAVLGWSILPGLQRAALLMAGGRAAPQSARLERRAYLWLKINLGLGVLVLALTALARAA